MEDRLIEVLNEGFSSSVSIENCVDLPAERRKERQRTWAASVQHGGKHKTSNSIWEN